MLSRLTFDSRARLRVYSPVQLVLVFEKTQSDTMNGRITPALVKEAARAVQMGEILLVGLAPPKVHVCDFEIAPEMAGAVTVGLEVFVRSPL